MIKYEEICKVFTSKVQEYINEGYTIYPDTMDCFESNVIAWVDLTDGENLYRVTMTNPRPDSYGFNMLEKYQVRVGVKNLEDSHYTNFTNEFEIISCAEYFIIGEMETDGYGRDRFVFGTYEDATAANEKRRMRYNSRKDDFRLVSRDCWTGRDITDDRRVNAVVPFLRRRLGVKTIQKKRVSVWKYTYNGSKAEYRVEYRGKWYNFRINR